MFFEETIVEERLDEDDIENCSGAANVTKAVGPPPVALPSDNPYEGILLEKEIDINTVFMRTQEGKAVMEILVECERRKLKPNDECLSRVKTILCDYLKYTYGLRPSPFYKNLLAISLVNEYTTVRSTTSEVRQALWFHPNARGRNKHSGRIHYHMEYLARKSEERVKRRNVGGVSDVQHQIEVCVTPEGELADLKGELKYLCPGPATESRAEELWAATYHDRSCIRQAGSLLSYLIDHPIAAAFDAKFISMEYKHMFPYAANFQERFGELQDKILTRYHDLFQNNQNGFLRTLAIIRLKNPSRGAKRLRDSASARENPLQGVIEWTQNDFSTLPASEVPVLYLKGNIMENVAEGCVMWKDWSAIIKQDAMYCFRVLCECFAVFNTSCKAEDKQFFLFISATFRGVGNLTTTGEKFMRNLD